jgi:predicted deacylase
MIRSACAALLLFFALLAAPLAASPRDFAIAGHIVAPGTRADLRLEVPAAAGDPATFIPLSVIHGAREGPVLALAAGVHGFEFASILAAERLAASLDPARIRGTVVIIRVANVNGFEGRSPNVNPVDGKNLNRVFPGKADGTQTERMAHAIASEVVARASFLMDLHSGDGAEFLEAFVGAYGGPLAHDFPLALKVAEGFGFPNLVRYSMKTQAQIDRGRSLNRQAVAMGVPTILVEIGQNGSREESHVAAMVAGIENALAIMGMADSPVRAVAPPQRLFESTASAEAHSTGIFHPVNLGPRPIAKGEVIGVIYDYTGREVERVVSPIDGYVLYGITGPPVTAGDEVVTIGIPTAGF